MPFWIGLGALFLWGALLSGASGYHSGGGGAGGGF